MATGKEKLAFGACLIWHIERNANHNLRAVFQWKTADGTLLHHERYSQNGLRDEIHRRRALGVSVAAFVKAMQDMSARLPDNVHTEP